VSGFYHRGLLRPVAKIIPGEGPGLLAGAGRNAQSFERKVRDLLESRRGDFRP
jgi:hypothetical protein